MLEGIDQAPDGIVRMEAVKNQHASKQATGHIKISVPTAFYRTPSSSTLPSGQKKPPRGV
jgi:hypothetical protein